MIAIGTCIYMSHTNNTNLYHELSIFQHRKIKHLYYHLNAFGFILKICFEKRKVKKNKTAYLIKQDIRYDNCTKQ